MSLQSHNGRLGLLRSPGGGSSLYRKLRTVMLPSEVVLHALKNAGGPLTLQEVSLQVGLAPEVVQEMLDFWVAQRRLRTVGAADGTLCMETGCHTCSAAGPLSCPMSLNPPVRYEIVPSLDDNRHGSA